MVEYYTRITICTITTLSIDSLSYLLILHLAKHSAEPNAAPVPTCGTLPEKPLMLLAPPPNAA